MSNILFKRGLHANLPASGKATDGAFYLTEDSHRLYVGLGTELVDLNKYIHVVATYDDLVSTGHQDGDFAYITGGNVLAVYNATTSKWIQINVNTNTTNSTFTATGDGGTDPGTLTLSLKDSENKTISSAVKFIGTQGTDVSVAADGTITVQGCEYELGGALSDKTYTITLGASDSEVDDTSIKLIAGTNVDFATTTGGITITADDTKLASTTTTVSGGTLSTSVTDTSGKTVSATAENVLYYTIGGTAYYNQSALPVYTTDEIDKLIGGMNGVTYKGTITAYGELPAAPAVGDMYMAANNFSYSGTDYVKGDLFIATGTETNGVITSDLAWTYVPSGDDSKTDTKYYGVANATNHSLTINDTIDVGLAAKIDLNAGDDGKIVLTSATSDSGKTLTTTIGHAAPGSDDSTKKTSGATTLNGYSFGAVTAQTVDATGHVGGYTVTTYTVPKASLATSVAATSNVATATFKLTDSASNTLSTSTLKIDASASDNLNATVSSGAIALTMEWVEF